MDLINSSLWVVMAVFLLYIPVLCYLDLRYREVEPRYWWPLLIVCIPITGSMYLSDQYPWFSLLISIVMCGIFYAVFRFGYLEGADFLFLCFISAFWVVNPNPWPHGLMQVIFYIYLIVAMLITAGYIMVYNINRGYLVRSIPDMVRLFSDYPNGFPFMLPISLAFVLSVVLG